MAYPPIFIILLISTAAVGATNPFLAFKMDESDILQPLIHLESNEDVEQAYRSKLRKYYRYELRSTGEPHLILAEIAQLTSTDIYTGFRKDDQSYLNGVVKNVFVRNKFNLSDLKAIRSGFEELTIDYSSRILQITLDKSDLKHDDSQDELRGAITDESIQEVFDEFVAEQNLSLAKEQKEQVVTAAQTAFKTALLEASSISFSILNFKIKSKDFALKTTKKLIDFVFALKGEQSPTTNEFMAHKITQLAKFVALVSPEEENMAFIQSIGRALTQDHLAWQVVNRGFIDKLIRNVLKTISESPRTDHIRIGKEIFVSYFAKLSDYPEPTEQYKKFIVRKYRRLGLKFTMKNLKAEYDRMLRIYAIDVVHTSMFLDYEMLEADDIKRLFTDFPQLAEDYSISEQVLFVKLRTMLLQAGDSLNKLPSLFESLYDSLLHCSQYYTHGYRGEISDPKQYALLYDDYLNWMHKWKDSTLLNLVWSWEPNPQYFPINILENYAFFKLINLATNTQQLAATGTAFRAFKYQNNYWIHKYSTETVPRRLLNYIRNRFVTNSSFNYQHLSGLDLDRTKVAGLAKYLKTAGDI